MKNLLFYLILGFSSQLQSRTIDDILSQKEIKKANYTLQTGTFEAIVVNMSYGEAIVIHSTNIKKLKSAEILEVHLVFSDYPKNINMTELNRSRILKSLDLRADLVSNENITWELVRQMACRNEAEANVMFHGLVIIYRPEQSKEELERERLAMDKILPPNPTLAEAKTLIATLVDTSLVTILKRKKWRDMTVVSDVTGSMSPFLTQLTLWFKLQENDKRLKNVVVFNDGDAKSDGAKITGQVEGIYSCSPKNYNDVKELIFSTMKKGCGGDGQENDVEALLYAQKIFKDAKELILIADNCAPMRDMELIANLKIPIRIILCGSKFGVNVQYLELARKTGGSVHTMEKDLENLVSMKEGEVLTIDGNSFRVVKGELLAIKKP